MRRRPRETAPAPAVPGGTGGALPRPIQKDIQGHVQARSLSSPGVRTAAAPASRWQLTDCCSKPRSSSQGCAAGAAGGWGAGEAGACAGSRRSEAGPQSLLRHQIKPSTALFKHLQLPCKARDPRNDQIQPLKQAGVQQRWLPRKAVRGGAMIAGPTDWGMRKPDSRFLQRQGKKRGGGRGCVTLALPQLSVCGRRPMLCALPCTHQQKPTVG